MTVTSIDIDPDGLRQAKKLAGTIIGRRFTPDQLDAPAIEAWEHPDEQQALDIQQALWDAGFMRAAAAFDCMIAAYAVANDAVILNSDHDFEYLEIATNGIVRQEYVAA